MKKNILVIFIALFFIKNLSADINKEVLDLKNEFKQIKEIYENKIEALEAKIEKLENEKNQPQTQVTEKSDSHDSHDGHSEESSFNIEAVLNGKYTSFLEVVKLLQKVLVLAHEGERGREGLHIGESELIMNADIGEKFSGSLTAALVREDGADKIELEEAYVESFRWKLLDNTYFKFGRAFWNVGVLNPQHAHADDFADRPLPYRVFLNKVL